MNKWQRQQLDGCITELIRLKRNRVNFPMERLRAMAEEIDEICDEEQDKLDRGFGTPLENTYRYQRMEQAVTALEEAVEKLKNISLDNARETIRLCITDLKVSVA